MAEVEPEPPRVPHLPDTGFYAYGSLFFTSGGKLLSVRLDWKNSSGPGSGFDGNAAAAALWTPLATAVQGVFTPSTTILQLRVSVRANLSQWSGVHTINVQGTVSATEAFPDVTNAVLRKNTSQPGPTGRGRIRWPSLPETFVNGNYLTTTGIAAYEALIAVWKAPTVDQTITYTPAVFSSKDRAFYTIGTMGVDQKVYTDRRRSSRI